MKRQLLLFYALLLLFSEAAVIFSQSNDDIRDLAEYLMVGYPILEDAPPLWSQAREIVRKKGNAGRLGSSGNIIFSYYQRPIVGTRKIYSEFSLGFQNVSFGKSTVSAELFADPFAYADAAFGYDASDRNPSDESSFFRSIGPDTFSTFQSVNELHIKTGHFGGRIELEFARAIRLTGDLALATFEHIPVSYDPGYDPNVYKADENLSSYSDPVGTERKRVRGELKIFPEQILPHVPFIIPEEITLEVSTQDQLTPEGYTISAKYTESGLGTFIGTVGYSKTRDVSFFNTLLQLPPLATSLVWQGETRLDGNNDIITRRLFIGLEPFMIGPALRGELSDFSEESEMFMSFAIGPEYISVPKDLTENFLFADLPRDWSLTLSLKGGFSESFALFIDWRISEIFHLFGDGRSDSQIRAGLIMTGI